MLSPHEDERQQQIRYRAGFYAAAAMVGAGLVCVIISFFLDSNAVVLNLDELGVILLFIAIIGYSVFWHFYGPVRKEREETERERIYADAEYRRKKLRALSLNVLGRGVVVCLLTIYCGGKTWLGLLFGVCSMAMYAAGLWAKRLRPRSGSDVLHRRVV